MARLIDHFYIAFTIILAVYSQLIMRWQVRLAGTLPDDLPGKANFIFSLFINPWVVSGLLATLGSGVAWMLALSRFDISYAYPWISLNFLLIALFGACLFEETFSIGKLTGTALVIAGVVIISKS